MPAAIAAASGESGQAEAIEPGAVVRCVLESIALRYRWVLERLEAAAGVRVEVVHLVGGGSPGGRRAGRGGGGGQPAGPGAGAAPGRLGGRGAGAGAAVGPAADLQALPRRALGGGLDAVPGPGFEGGVTCERFTRRRSPCSS